MSGWVRGEGPFAVPDLSNQLVHEKRQSRRAERAGGGELPPSTAPRASQKPEREGGDRDHRNSPVFEGAEPASEPGVVVDELVNGVVDAIVHPSVPGPNGIGVHQAAKTYRCFLGVWTTREVEDQRTAIGD